jgi:AraC-like DNA-binding protein
MPAFNDLVFAPYIRDADMAGRAPWHVAPRRLLDYLLVYVQQGDCRFAIEGEVVAPPAGSFCLIQPGQSVELRGVSRTVTPYAHFDLFYNARREESFATRPGQMNLATYHALMQPALSDLDDTILPSHFAPPSSGFCEDWLKVVRLWSSGGVLARQEAAQRLGILMLQLLHWKREQAGGASTPSADARDFGWIPSYLSTHLSQPISVSQMAGRARLSPSRFHAVFQKKFGVAPGRYLLEMRVRHAGELLTSTNWTLAHIAELCGFADVHHFARTFKRLTGSTPGAHRRGEKTS